MAERGGFEPPVQCYPYDGLANRSFRPLRHLSEISSLMKEIPDYNPFFHNFKSKWRKALIKFPCFRMAPLKQSCKNMKRIQRVFPNQLHSFLFHIFRQLLSWIRIPLIHLTLEIPDNVFVVGAHALNVA